MGYVQMLNCKVSNCKFICFCALGIIYLKASILSSENCKEEEVIYTKNTSEDSAFSVIHFEEFVLSSHIITQLSCIGRDRNQEKLCCAD